MEGNARRVAVVGAGLAGLYAAWELRRRGLAVAVVEAGASAGGRVRGESVDGFELESASPVLSSADAELLHWVDALGLRDEFLPLRPLIEAQARGGRVDEIDARGLFGVARIPGVRARQALRLVRLERLMRRYRSRLEPDAPEDAASLDDRSIADFGRLYFGDTVVDRWMGPFATADSLGDAACASRAHFLRRYASHGGARAGLPRAALSELPRAAAARLRVRCGARATRLEPRTGGGIRVFVETGGRERVMEADGVVVATTAPEAAALSSVLLDPAERDGFARVDYAPSLAVAVALRRSFSAHPRQVHFPPGEGSPLETALFEPGVTGGRVPDGHGLATLRATGAWSRAHLDADDEAVTGALLDAAAQVEPGLRGAALFTRVLRAERSQPRFDVGRYRDIARFARVQADQRGRGRRVYFAGDYLMDPSLSGALASARRAARDAAADLAA